MEIDLRERQLLGGFLQAKPHDNVEESRRMLDQLGLSADDFAFAFHANLFRQIDATLRAGRPATPDRIAELLHPKGGIPEKNAAELLADYRLRAVSDRSTMSTLAAEVKAAARMREVAVFCEGMAAEARSPDVNAASIGERFAGFTQRLVTRAEGYSTVTESIDRLSERQAAIQRDEVEPRLKTGVRFLDDVLGGGLLPNLTVIGGMPGTGKTALGASFVRNWAKAGVLTGLFPLEDGVDDGYASRFVAEHSGLSWGTVAARKVPAEDEAKMLDGFSEWHYVGRNIQTIPNVRSFTARQVVETARDWVINKRVKVLLLDHLGELRVDGVQREHRTYAVRDALEELRTLAVNYQVPVVVLAHFNREAARDGGRPNLQHFAESEYVGRMARLALGIWHAPPDEDHDDIRRMWVSVMKFTRGDARRREVVRLHWKRKCALVDNEAGDLYEDKK